MAGTAWQVTQKGLIGFQKNLFHGIPTNNWVYFEVKLGWCSDLIICLIKYQVCSPTECLFRRPMSLSSLIYKVSDFKLTLYTLLKKEVALF